MENKTIKKAIYNKYNKYIAIQVIYRDGTIKGSFSILDTPLGFKISAVQNNEGYNGWKILSDCSDLFQLLESQSMSDMTLETLMEKIKDIGYITQ